MLLVSFRETITSYVTIPGEQAKIPVSAYKTEGQICKKFQNFYNSEKHCAEEITSAKFREEGHRPDNRAFQVVVGLQLFLQTETDNNSCCLQKQLKTELQVERLYGSGYPMNCPHCSGNPRAACKLQ